MSQEEDVQYKHAEKAASAVDAHHKAHYVAAFNLMHNTA
jgi:hypothetical protein